VWFTDPGYGILRDYEGSRAEFELPTSVYRLNPESGEATVVTDELDRPNGLSFTPDYTMLYVTDTGSVFPQTIVGYDVENGARLVNRRALCDTSPATPDGIRCDVDGNIWTSASFAGEEYDGVQVFAPNGDLIGRIHLPETVANLCFGGAKMNRLFITASQSIYSLYVEAQGIRL
jgi:gluconolactonase